MQRDFLPISIGISGKNILLIGGGKVAMEKIVSLRRFTTNITIVSMEFCSEIQKMSWSLIRKAYEKTDLRGFFLVYACTNNAEVNALIRRDCHELGILVNVVDNPGLCDFISPAIFVDDNMSVAVSSDGKDVKRSIKLRDKLRGILHG